ncbi:MULTISPECIES: MFS transporter [unclassified Avibacterium]|uniref:MFS transporter n=1 Tax=unclassified Avibacterium TaxID=2685287 RepID=UPI002027321D|nr:MULTISPECIES: MFS transporter [unclassified Avibacterium]MCW9698812.1 MFS transporter [Avibacterium sp. 20-129]URL06969.1 MFS transporter [Avibacterium sp. 21-595]
MNIRHLIDQHPMTPYQWAVVVMATIMNLLDGFDVLALAFTATGIRHEFGLTGAELGSLLSAGLFGMAAGSLFLAPLADKIGRRPLLLISVSLSAAGMLGSFFAIDSSALGIWRIVTGLGVGGILVGTNVLTSEYSSKKWRSLAISIYAAGFGIGAILGGLFAVALQAEYGWRSVFLAGAILTGLCLLCLILWLPESIDYLVNKQPNNAQARLNRILKKIGIASFILPELTEHKAKTAPITQLFNPQYRSSTLAIWLAFFTIMFSFYFISSWTPALLKDAGMTTEQSVTIGMMISLGGTCGALFYGLLASYWSARNVLILFTIIAAIAVIAFILSSTILWLAMVLGIMVGALINGCISGLYTLNPSIYPSDIRSTGAGWSIGIGRIGAILAPIIAGILLDNGWEKQNLYIGAAFVLLISTFALLLLKRNTMIKTL